MNGSELKQRRKRLGLTQTDLAKHWNVTQANLSLWENDKIRIQHPEILNDALKYLESKNVTKCE